MKIIRSEVIGCGAYLPDNILTNQELSQKLDTSDEWIRVRTGIKQRHIATEKETTSTLAIRAAEDALKNAKLSAQSIDLIILATSTPDRTFPATAVTIQGELGITQGAAFDLQAVCSGFIYALSVADNFIRAGQANKALVIGAEVFSRILDWSDRGTCVLFGDGAGAIVMQSVEAENVSPKTQRGILSTVLHSDGRYRDILYVDGGPATTQTVGCVRMSGKEVFRHAVVNLTQVVDEVLERSSLTYGDVDWLIPHQANRRILKQVAQKMDMSMDRVVMTIDRHANTSAASIPLALNVALKDNRIQKGDLLLLEAMGGGLTWGAGLIRW